MFYEGIKYRKNKSWKLLIEARFAVFNKWEVN